MFFNIRNHNCNAGTTVVRPWLKGRGINADLTAQLHRKLALVLAQMPTLQVRTCTNGHDMIAMLTYHILPDLCTLCGQSKRWYCTSSSIHGQLIAFCVHSSNSFDEEVVVLAQLLLHRALSKLPSSSERFVMDEFPVLTLRQELKDCLPVVILGEAVGQLSCSTDPTKLGFGLLRLSNSQSEFIPSSRVS